MTKPRLIALCSPVMASGKSTIAEHLVTNHRFARLAFASPIKAMTKTLLQCCAIGPMLAERMVNGDLKESVVRELGVTPRFLQQRIGTEFGRDCISQDIWVRIALDRAAQFMAGGISVVIDDLRFPNEYDAVHAAGGSCYRIVRPDAALTGGTHASEGQLDGIHMPEIWNTGSLDDLRAAADRTLFVA